MYGRYTWAGSGIAPGCPAIDPVGYPYTIAPGATYTLSQPWGDTYPTCQATGLTMTVNVNGATGTVAAANASLVIQQPASTCHVTYSPSNWQGGFTANVTISNAGSAPINGWTLTFSFPGDQKIPGPPAMPLPPVSASTAWPVADLSVTREIGKFVA